MEILSKEAITTPSVVVSISVCKIIQKVIVLFKQILTPNGLATDGQVIVGLGATEVVL